MIAIRSAVALLIVHEYSEVLQIIIARVGYAAIKVGIF